MTKRTVTILATADLHYDIARSRRPTEEIARHICDTPADALVLVGDTAGPDLNVLRDCLHLFDAFAGSKLVVPGNHCLWCRQENEDSLTRYNHSLPETATEAGFTLLDHQPQIIGHVGLVSSIGWYDYSFRDHSLGVPLDFYRHKVAPGAARYYGQPYHQILEEHDSVLQERHFQIPTRWMDGQFIRLGMSDEEFTEYLAQKLKSQLSELAPEVDQIAAFLHHLPFAELVPANRPDKFAFAAAYMGSGRFGEILQAEPKVTHVLCGHSHWPAHHVVGHLEVINIGCSYTHKRMEVLLLRPQDVRPS